AHNNRVYYVNSRLYQFHKDFLNGTYLSIERGRALYENNYLNAKRRFVLGTIAYYATASAFTFELWEGDRITGDMLADAYKAITASFFDPISFKPNSLYQEERAAEVNGEKAVMPVLTLGDLARTSGYQPLNNASG